MLKSVPTFGTVSAKGWHTVCQTLAHFLMLQLKNCLFGNYSLQAI